MRKHSIGFLMAGSGYPNKIRLPNKKRPLSYRRRLQKAFTEGVLVDCLLQLASAKLFQHRPA